MVSWNSSGTNEYCLPQIEIPGLRTRVLTEEMILVAIGMDPIANQAGLIFDVAWSISGKPPVWASRKCSGRAFLYGISPNEGVLLHIENRAVDERRLIRKEVHRSPGDVLRR